MEEETSPTGKTRISDRRDLRIVVEFVPGEGCPLREVDGEIQAATIQLRDGGCQCDLVLGSDSTGEEQVEHQSVTIEDPALRTCACQVFGDYDCVPQLLGTNGETVRMATYVTNREVAWELLDSLGEVSDGLTLRRVTNSAVGGQSAVVELDLSALSEKQRSAMEFAVSQGYFASGSAVSLEELATELGISASALSQRLQRAEETLLTQVFE